MSKMRFKLKRSGVRELMRSAAMMDVCQGYAGRALQRLGDGYEADPHVGRSRCNVSVYARSFKARRENSKNNTVLKAVRG